MFIVKDCTRNPPYTMVSNDAKNVRDIVIGITGDEMVGDHVLLHLGHMTFGQFLVWGQLFIIKCVPDEDAQALYLKGKTMSNAWHPCQYVDCKLEHDGSWIDGKWYEWEDVHGNREVARMKLDAIDHFYPHAKIIKEEDVCRYRELEEGEDNADH